MNGYIIEESQMETTIQLLFRLNIQLPLYDKLKDSYYIPEQYVKQLNVGGKVFAVQRYVYPKVIFDMGKLERISDDVKKLICSRRKHMEITIQDFHIFYVPHIHKTTRAMISLQNSLTTSS